MSAATAVAHRLAAAGCAAPIRWYCDRIAVVLQAADGRFSAPLFATPNGCDRHSYAH
jgi:hypothetical protein